MVGKLLGGGLVLLGTAFLCRAETRTRRQQTERLAELSAALSEMAAGIRSLRRTLPCLLRQQTRRPLCGAYFGAVLEGLESGQPLPDAWADAFRQLEPPEAGRVLRDTELTGDEEKLTAALLYAARQLKDACRRRGEQLDRLADTRRRDRRQQERLLWTAALSGAALFIILLM